MNVLSPFQKIKFEDYSLEHGSGYSQLVERVFEKFKAERRSNALTIPFPKMSGTEIEIWKAYCPQREKLSEATCGIHSEALKLVERYADKFDWIEVWNESGDQIDPVMVGLSYKNVEAREKNYSWSVDYFLMARWGEAIKSLSEIKQLVFDAHMRRERVRLQTELNNLEFEAMRKFGI